MAEDHVALAGQIAEGLRDAGLAVDAVHGGPAALTQAGITAQHWPAVVPLWATTGGPLATLGHRRLRQHLPRLELVPSGGPVPGFPCYLRGETGRGRGPGPPEGAWVAASPAPTAVTWLGPRLPA